MADIKGITSVLRGKTITGADKVIVTDNLYLIADINKWATDSGKPVKLEKTSALTKFEGTEAVLNTVLKNVEKYTGPVLVTVAATADKINEIAGLTTGVVTANILGTQTVADVAGNISNVTKADNISYVTADVTANAAHIVAVKAKIPTANLNTVVTITGDLDSGNTVADFVSASKILSNAAVVVTGEISAANANAIAKNTSGIVTATDVTAATAAALKSALKDAKATDALTLVVSGKTATAADLKALDAKTSVAVNANSIETVTGNAADVIAVLTSTTTLVTPAITVSGTITAADALAIGGNGKAGVVTAKVESGEAFSLKNTLSALDGTDKLSLTVVNNSNGNATSAADLVALALETVSKITVNAKAITGNIADLELLYVNNTKEQFVGLGNKAVTINAGASESEVNSILAATSGVVTATLSASAEDLKLALTAAKSNDKLILNVTGNALASDLKALDAKTSSLVSTATGVKITGSGADLKTVIKSSGIELVGDEDIVVTNKVSASDANTFSAATTGIVTAEVNAGSAAALNKALSQDKDGAGTDVENALTLTVTGATAAASDLIGLDAKTSVDVDATAVKTITGNINLLDTISDASNTTILVNSTANATVTDKVLTSDLSKLNDLIDDANSIIDGKITATVEANTSAILAAAINKGDGKDALNINVVENVTGIVVTATDAEDLVALDGQTSLKVKVDATQITGTYAKVEHVYVSGKAGFSNLGNETVTIINNPVAPNTAADIDKILAATSGVVTASVTASAASDLVANLKNAKNDKLALEITATETKASDLKALDAKTSVQVNADIITKLVGNAADVKAVLASTTGIKINAAEVIDVTGKISIADANTITSATTGIVTAEVAAGTAEALSSGLVDSNGGANALKLTVTGASADAAHLNSLNLKTTVDVDAAAIKTVTGNSTVIETLYNGTGVSGLGNENVTVSNSDALATNIFSINSDTTGVINVSTVNTTAATAFKLADLGDLSGITGLYNLSTVDTAATVITLSIADLLAANDSKKSFDFSVVGDANDTLNFTDVSGWTSKQVVAGDQYTFTKGSQTITVNLTNFDAGDVVLPA